MIERMMKLMVEKCERNERNERNDNKINEKQTVEISFINKNENERKTV